VKYRDIVIHTNAPIAGKEDTVKAFPPIRERIDLSQEIWVGRLELDVAKAIMDTCEPKTVGVIGPYRQYAHLYAFVRELPVPADIYHWDHDNELTAAIGLSRLIHPTTIGFDYAARIGYEPGGVKEICPAQRVGISKEAFLSSNQTRDWLTETDGKALSKIVPGLRKELPRRVHNGLWHHEYAQRTFYVDHRWTLVCTGLEAMVHTDRKRNTAQFTLRVPRLAAEVGVTISEQDAIEAYDLRSRLAHGVSFIATGSESGPSPSQIDLYDRLENTLRKAVLRGMKDENFANVLRDDAKVRGRWPI
jgi:hypothetical protein